MNINVFKSKSKGSIVGMNHLRKNIAGSWYWQFWFCSIHLVIGNGGE